MWQHLSTPDVVQDFVDYALAWLDDRNYTLAIDSDLAGWAAMMRGVPGAFVNPAFDPAQSRLSPQDSFWLDIRAGSETIATSTARLFVTDDYLGLKRSLRLWYEQPPAHWPALAVSVSPDVPFIRGRVGHEGGLWVHPAHRKKGLSTILPHLNRALCLREWNIGWQTGITMRGIGESGLAERAYGFPHVVRCFEGFLPVTGRSERLYMTYMDRAELMAGIEIDAVARLLPDRHEQPAHAVRLTQHG